MIQNIALQHIRHVSDDAKRRRVILARTREPRARSVVLDVHLARGMHEAEEPPGHGRDRILLVIDVRHIAAVAATVRRVDVVRGRAVPHARHAVADRAHARVWR